MSYRPNRPDSVVDEGFEDGSSVVKVDLANFLEEGLLTPTQVEKISLATELTPDEILNSVDTPDLFDPLTQAVLRYIGYISNEILAQCLTPAGFAAFYLKIIDLEAIRQHRVFQFPDAENALHDMLNAVFSEEGLMILKANKDFVIPLLRNGCTSYEETIRVLKQCQFI